MNRDTVDQLNQINQDFYRGNAQSFSQTRQSPWKGWGELAKQLKLKDLSRIKVLDLGCGNGRFLAFLKNFGLESTYTGVDFSQNLLQEARVKYQDKGVEFIQTDLLDLNLPGKTGYDLVVLWGLLHHIPGFENRVSLLSQAKSFLTTDGIMAFSVWQFGKDPRLLTKIIPWSHQSQIDSTQLELNDHLLNWKDSVLPRYCHFIDDLELDQLVQDAGLEQMTAFLADGKTNQLNKYIVSKLRQSH